MSPAISGMSFVHLFETVLCFFFPCLPLQFVFHSSLSALATCPASYSSSYFHPTIGRRLASIFFTRIPFGLLIHISPVIFGVSFVHLFWDRPLFLLFMACHCSSSFIHPYLLLLLAQLHSNDVIPSTTSVIFVFPRTHELAKRCTPDNLFL